MKISKRQLRKMIRESMADYAQKFDDAYRQSDGSYSGHPDEEPEDSWYSDQDETFADYKYRVAQEEDELAAEDLGGMHDEFEEEELRAQVYIQGNSNKFDSTSFKVRVSNYDYSASIAFADPGDDPDALDLILAPGMSYSFDVLVSNSGNIK